MVVAWPFAGIRPTRWELLDHLQPRSARFESDLPSAVADLAARRDDGRLRDDEAPSGSALRATQVVDGVAHTASGIVLAIDVTAGDRDVVLAHEHTFPEPVERRVRTREALRAETVPSMLLLRRDVPGLRDVLTAAIEDEPLRLSTPGSDQLLGRIDEAAARDVAERLRGIPALIADGHHRVAAATASHLQPGTTLAWLAGPTTAPALLPVHRMLHGLPTEVWRRLESAGIVLEPLPPAAHPEVLVLVTADRACGLSVRLGSAAHRARRDWHPALAKLPVLLGEHVLHAILGLGRGRDAVATTTDAVAAVAAVADGVAEGALLGCGPHLDEVWAAADLGLRLPPKATWFTPKPLSGGILRPLQDAPREDRP